MFDCARQRHRLTAQSGLSIYISNFVSGIKERCLIPSIPENQSNSSNPVISFLIGSIFAGAVILSAHWDEILNEDTGYGLL